MYYFLTLAIDFYCVKIIKFNRHYNFGLPCLFNFRAPPYLRILTNDRLVVARECLNVLKKHGSSYRNYNWLLQLRHFLELVNMGQILDDLDVDIIRDNIKEVRATLEKYYWDEDVLRAQNSSYFFLYTKKVEQMKAEPYLLLHMNKVFTFCIASIRLNRHFLKLGGVLLDFRDEAIRKYKFFPEVMSIAHILDCKSKTDDMSLQYAGSVEIIPSDLDMYAYEKIYIFCKLWIMDYV